MTSACYVYAIVGRDNALPAAYTVDGGTKLTIVPWRELGAVTAGARDDGSRITMQAVLHHETVVEAVRRRGPALPVRFGTVFRDATSLTSALAERYEPLMADLRRLGDKAELSLTVLWTAPPCEEEVAAPVQEGSNELSAGAQYLRRRIAEHRLQETLREKARAVARDIDDALGKIAIERRFTILPTPRVALRAAYLLEPSAVSAFRAAFETIRGQRAELRVLLTGPWPPYSFVKQSESGAAGALAQLLTETMCHG